MKKNKKGQICFDFCDPKDEPISESSLCKFMVLRFLPEKLDSSLWAREIKIAKKLLPVFQKYPINSFPRLELPSLAWFLTSKGQKFIQEQKEIVDCSSKQQTTSVEVHQEKIGDDYKPVQYNKTVSQFLGVAKK